MSADDLKAVRMLLAFVWDMMSVIRVSSDLQLAVLTKLQRTVYNNQDRYLAFRERAMGRMRMTAPDGPMNPSNIDAPGAIASGLIWRGITFGCRVVRKRQTFFRSVDDWNALLHSLSGMPDRYFCDKGAYGTTISGRSVGLAPAFFEAEIVCRDLLRKNAGADGKVDFKIFYRIITSKNLSRTFPQCGPLILLLFSGDLCMAGKLREPSVEDMAELAVALNSGAVTGLSFCGLISASSSAADKRDAFIRAYRFIDANLVDAEKREIVWNPITFEHILCKIQRVARLRNELSAM